MLAERRVREHMTGMFSMATVGGVVRALIGPVRAAKRCDTFLDIRRTMAVVLQTKNLRTRLTRRPKLAEKCAMMGHIEFHPSSLSRNQR